VHLHHVYQKLEISNRTVLAALALSHNESADVVPRNHAPRNRCD
jgi:two-component system nitrate/nitrite response regulator NarL